MDNRHKVLIGGGIGLGAGVFFAHGEVLAEEPNIDPVDISIPDQSESPPPIVVDVPIFESETPGSGSSPVVPEDQQAPSPDTFVLPLDVPVVPDVTEIEIPIVVGVPIFESKTDDSDTTPNFPTELQAPSDTFVVPFQEPTITGVKVAPRFIEQDADENIVLSNAPVQTIGTQTEVIDSTPENTLIYPTGREIKAVNTQAIAIDSGLNSAIIDKNPSVTHSDRPSNVGLIREQNNPGFQNRSENMSSGADTDSLPDVFPQAERASNEIENNASVTIDVPLGLTVSIDKLVVGPENVAESPHRSNQPVPEVSNSPSVNQEAPRLGVDNYENSFKIISSSLASNGGKLDQQTAILASEQLLLVPHVERSADFTKPELIVSMPQPTVDAPYLVHPNTCKLELTGTHDSVMAQQYSIALFELMLQEPAYEQYKDTVIEIGDMASGDHNTHGKGNKNDSRSRTMTTAPSTVPDGPILNTLSPRYNRDFTIDFLIRKASAVRADGMFLYQRIEYGDQFVIDAVNAAAGRQLMDFVEGHEEHVHEDVGINSEEDGDIATPNTTGSCEFANLSMSEEMIKAVLVRRQASLAPMAFTTFDTAAMSPAENDQQASQALGFSNSGTIDLAPGTEVAVPTKLQLFHTIEDIGRFASGSVVDGTVFADPSISGDIQPTNSTDSGVDLNNSSVGSETNSVTEQLPLIGSPELGSVNGRFELAGDWSDQLKARNPNWSDEQFAFAADAFENFVSLANRGYRINPMVATTQAILESGFGSSDLARDIRNPLGLTTSPDDPRAYRFLDRGNVRYAIDFTTEGDNGFGEAYEYYAERINTADHYADAAACYYDLDKYVSGLQNENDFRCVTIRPHNDANGNLTAGVLSYAEDNGYQETIAKRARDFGFTELATFRSTSA